MSIECRECERDLRGPHAKNCSRYQPDDDLEGDFEVSGTTMSDKHESGTPRQWVFSNGTIGTEYGLGGGEGRLHLESTAGETVLVPSAELLQFLSDHDIERQLAAVTAERDALKTEVRDLRALLATVAERGRGADGQREWVEAERDALKRRVEELEQRRELNAKGPCTCGAPEWCPA